MWNLKDIKQKKDYVREMIQCCSNEKERKEFFLTLRNYMFMLEESGTFQYTGVFNFLDKITSDHFSFYYYMWMLKGQDIDFSLFSSCLIDENYLSFLLQVAYNVSHTGSLDRCLYDPIFRVEDYDYDFIETISMIFYSSLQDKEIWKYAKKVIESEDSFQVSKIMRCGLENSLGTTFHDFVFHKSYSLVHKQNNILDLQIYMHEVLHQIDFYMQPKSYFFSYFGFHEIPTYALEYKFLFFLYEFGFSKEEVQKLELQKDLYLQRLAILTIQKIKTSLSKNHISMFSSIHDVYKILDISILRSLLEIEAGVIASMLGRELVYTPNIGLQKLKKFMDLLLPKDKRPDFSFVGFDEETILKSSREVGSFSKYYIKK